MAGVTVRLLFVAEKMLLKQGEMVCKQIPAFVLVTDQGLCHCAMLHLYLRAWGGVNIATNVYYVTKVVSAKPLESAGKIV